MTVIKLSCRQVSDIMSEAEAAVQVTGYYSQPVLEVRGSKDSKKKLTATITTDGQYISIAISEGKRKDPDRIQMRRSHFPGTAREFLESLTFGDPDATPLSLRVIAQGHRPCVSAKDGGF